MFINRHVKCIHKSRHELMGWPNNNNSAKEISLNRLKSVLTGSYIFTNIFHYRFCVSFHQILERPFVLITACFNRTPPACAYCVSFENGRTKGQVVRVENKKHAVKVKLCREQWLNVSVSKSFLKHAFYGTTRQLIRSGWSNREKFSWSRGYRSMSTSNSFFFTYVCVYKLLWWPNI